ncbi:MAG: hypothetical protein FJW34_18280 [Acidobacteria bacterium]|nr:hypothetical protein [Acidobacteriota bacterium]
MKALLLLCLGPLLLAQDRPQLVWEGQVDGVSVLRAHGNRIDVEERQGLPVQRQRFRFFERLPDSRLTVRLEVVEGRGQVRILEQPRLENNYTLAVLIDDRQGGSSFYSLAFFWESRRGFFEPSRPSPPPGLDRMENLTWSGRVDDEVVVSCRREECIAEAVRGADATRDRFRFSRPLPGRDVQVSLDRTEGRGQIRLLQQPREENGYTAQVGIRDPQGGAGDYSFTLAWARPSREDPGFSFARRGMVWSGRVDGRVRVIVEGSNARAELITGAPVAGERAEFSRALPARNNSNATLRRLRGRGRAEIVEFPSARNGYRLVFEIDDSGGGAGDYEVEVGW